MACRDQVWVDRNGLTQMKLLIAQVSALSQCEGKVVMQLRVAGSEPEGFAVYTNRPGDVALFHRGGGPSMKSVCSFLSAVLSLQLEEFLELRVRLPGALQTAEKFGKLEMGL